MKLKEEVEAQYVKACTDTTYYKNMCINAGLIKEEENINE